MEMLFDQREVDSYIAEHQYGGATEQTQVDPDNNLEYFDLDKMQGSTPSSSKLAGSQNKLSPFEVYIALVKGYCVILILIIPRAFVTGGWLMSAVLMMCSGVVSTVCANCLVQAGL